MALRNIFGRKRWSNSFQAGKDALNQNQFEEAEQHLREALEKAQELGADDPAVAETAYHLAYLFSQLGNLSDALAMGRMAYEVGRRCFEPTDNRLIGAVLQVIHLNPEFRFDNEALFFATVDVVVQTYGDPSFQLFAVRAARLMALTPGDPAWEPLAEMICANASSAFGSGAKEDRSALLAQRLGQLFDQAGHPGRAVKFFAWAVRILESTNADSETIATGLLYLSRALEREGNHERAEVSLRRALEMFKLRLTVEDPRLKQATVLMARILVKMEKIEAAQPYLLQSLELLSATDYDGRAFCLLGLLETACKDPSGDQRQDDLLAELRLLEPHLEESVKIGLVDGLRATARRLFECWNFEPGLKLYAALLSASQRLWAPNHPEVARALCDMADALLVLGDRQEALKYSEQVIAVDDSAVTLLRGAQFKVRSARLGEARQLAQMASRQIRMMPADQLSEELMISLGRVLFQTGLAGEGQALLDDLGSRKQRSVAVGLFIGEMTALRGDLRRAEIYFGQAGKAATRPLDQVRSQRFLALNHLRQGRFSDARATLETALDIGRDFPDNGENDRCRVAKLYLDHLEGNLDFDELETVLLSLETSLPEQSRLWLDFLPYLCLCHPTRGVEMAQRLLNDLNYPEQHIPAYPFPDLASCALLALTEHALGRGDVAQAQERARQLLGWFQPGAEDPLSGRHLYVAAQAAHLAGDEDQADAHLEAALEQFSRIGYAQHPWYKAAKKGLSVQARPATPEIADETPLDTEEIPRARIMEAVELEPPVHEEAGSGYETNLIEAPLWGQQLAPTPAVEMPGDIPIAEPDEVSEPDDGTRVIEPQPLRLEPPPVSEVPSRLPAPDPERETEPEREPEPEPDPEPEPVTQVRLEAPRAARAPRITADQFPLETRFHDPLLLLKAPLPKAKPIPPPPPPAPVEKAPEPIKSQEPAPVEPLEVATEEAVAVGPQSPESIPGFAELAGAEEVAFEEVEALLQECRARCGTPSEVWARAAAHLSLKFEADSEESLELVEAALEECQTLVEQGLSIDLGDELAEVFRSDDRLEATLNALACSLQWVQNSHGQGSAEAAQTLVKMAEVYLFADYLEDAQGLLENALATLESWYGKFSVRLLDCLGNLLTVYSRSGNWEEAEVLARRRLKIIRGTTDFVLVLDSLTTLIEVCIETERWSEVPALLEEVEQLARDQDAESRRQLVSRLAVLVRRLREDLWSTETAAELLKVSNGLAVGDPVSSFALNCEKIENHFRNGSLKLATDLFKDLKNRVFEFEGEERKRSLIRLSSVAQTLGELDEARSLAENALDSQVPGGGKGTLTTGEALLRLAESDLAAFRLEGAETAVAMAEPSLSSSSSWSRACLTRGVALAMLNRLDEAEAEFEQIEDPDLLPGYVGYFILLDRFAEAEEALSARLERDKLGGRDVEALTRMAEVEFYLGRPAEVRRVLDQIGEILGQRIARDDPRRRAFLVLEGWLALWGGKLEEALQLALEAGELAVEPTVLLPWGLQELPTRLLQVEAHLALDDIKAAQRVANETYALASDCFGEEDIRSARAALALAKVSSRKGDLDRAMTLYGEASELLTEVLGTKHSWCRDAYFGVAEVFQQRGDLESARAYAREALEIDESLRESGFHMVEDYRLLARIERGGDLGEAEHLIETAMEVAQDALGPSHAMVTALEEDLDRINELLEMSISDDDGIEAEEAPIPEEEPVAAEVEELEAEPAPPELAEAEDMEAPAEVAEIEVEEAVKVGPTLGRGLEAPPHLMPQTEPDPPEEEPVMEVPQTEPDPPEEEPVMEVPQTEPELPEEEPVMEVPQTEPELPEEEPVMEVPQTEPELPEEEPVMEVPQTEPELPEEEPVMEVPQTEPELPEEEPVMEVPQTEPELPEEEPVMEVPQTEPEPVEEEPVMEVPQTEPEPVEEEPVMEAAQTEPELPEEEPQAEAEPEEEVVADTEDDDEDDDDDDDEDSSEERDRTLEAKPGLRRRGRGLGRLGRRRSTFGRRLKRAKDESETEDSGEEETPSQEETSQEETSTEKTSQETTREEEPAVAAEDEEAVAEAVVEEVPEEEEAVAEAVVEAVAEEEDEEEDQVGEAPEDEDAVEEAVAEEKPRKSQEFLSGERQVPSKLRVPGDAPWQELDFPEAPDGRAHLPPLPVSLRFQEDPCVVLLPPLPFFSLPLPDEPLQMAAPPDSLAEPLTEFINMLNEGKSERRVFESFLRHARGCFDQGAGETIAYAGYELHLRDEHEWAGRFLQLAIAAFDDQPSAEKVATYHLLGRRVAGQGAIEPGLNYLGRAKAIALELAEPNPRPLATLDVDLGLLCITMGRTTKAVELLSSAYEKLSQSLPKPQAMMVQSTLARALVLDGQVARAKELLEDLDGALGTVSNPLYTSLTRMNMAKALGLLGDPEAGSRSAEASIEWVKKQRESIPPEVERWVLLGYMEQLLLEGRDISNFEKELPLFNGLGLVAASLLMARGALQRGSLRLAERYFKLAQGVNYDTPGRSWDWRALEGLSDIAYSQRRIEVAWNFAWSAFQQFQAVDGKGLELSRHLLRLALLHDARGEVEMARQRRDQAFEVRREVLGDDHPFLDACSMEEPTLVEFDFSAEPTREFEAVEAEGSGD